MQGGAQVRSRLAVSIKVQTEYLTVALAKASGSSTRLGTAEGA